MNNSKIIAAAGIAAVVVLFIVHSRHQPPNQTAAEPAQQIKPATAPTRRGPYIPAREVSGIPRGSEQVKEGRAYAIPADFIRGKPAEQGRHIAVQFFLKSQAKDTPEGQAIAILLLTNGYGVEHISPAYWAARGLTGFIDTYPQTNETLVKMIAGVTDSKIKKLMYGDKGAGVTPIDEATAERVLAFRPRVPYQSQNSQVILNAVQGPEGRWLGAQDILDYIKAHPAAPIAN
jgi:hypothetical protein